MPICKTCEKEFPTNGKKVNCPACLSRKRCKNFIDGHYEFFEPYNHLLSERDIQYIESSWKENTYANSPEVGIMWNRIQKKYETIYERAGRPSGIDRIMSADIRARLYDELRKYESENPW